MQRIEHYEIRCLRHRRGALAEALGEKEVAGLLHETLEEEKQTDLKLTEVTRTAIMPEALAADEEGDGERTPGGRLGRTTQSRLVYTICSRHWPGERRSPGLIV